MTNKIHDLPNGDDWFIDGNSSTQDETWYGNTIQTKLNKKHINKRAEITFIGDSVIDCKSYTRTGKGTVEYFAEAYANETYMSMINDQSRDGDTIFDCIDKANQINADSKLVVVSAGGNDLLKLISMVSEIDDTNLLNGLLLSELDKLSMAYETMLQQFKPQATYLMMTVYEGNFAYNPQRFYGMDYTARAIVSMWNDRISRIARDKNSRNNKSSYDVLDVRDVMSPNCYYNEIEPNEIGAKRIAKAIKRYVNETGVLL
tara:strand:+ start:434 stop:1210 length:777 start_codon:yes stop_codon:yes gene_type:complete